MLEISAHVGGIPVEETALSLAPAFMAAFAAVAAAMRAAIRRRSESR
jgi:hypothetical protein